ncbi:hypothetical protein RI129_011026 [Pyrocoelia pectoralis]|uniref:Gag-like protein n=1 Tax=Pyrocoelia pectoralis TaxID=417401 RepID=A0AAN7V063_9COLE
MIQKQLFGLIGEVKSIRKVKDGMLIETVSTPQAKKLFSSERLDSPKIEVTPENTLNYSKGMVNCKNLLVEICSELKSHEVTKVRRIKKKVNGELQGTPNHVLTFNTPKLAPMIKAGYLVLSVRVHVPAPIRCFRCQITQMCVCGKELHGDKRCEDSIECVNCKGNHLDISKSWPIYKQESVIQEIKVKENISYLEARRKVGLPTPHILW